MGHFFLVLVILAIVALIVFVWVMLELRKAITALKDLVSTTENSLKPTVAELQETLKSVRNLADNATVMSEDIRVLSGALRGIGTNVKRASGDVNHLVDFVDGMTSSALVETACLKAAVKAGGWHFIRNLFNRVAIR